MQCNTQHRMRERERERNKRGSKHWSIRSELRAHRRMWIDVHRESESKARAIKKKRKENKRFWTYFTFYLFSRLLWKTGFKLNYSMLDVCFISSVSPLVCGKRSIRTIKNRMHIYIHSLSRLNLNKSTHIRRIIEMKQQHTLKGTHLQCVWTGAKWMNDSKLVWMVFYFVGMFEWVEMVQGRSLRSSLCCMIVRQIWFFFFVHIWRWSHAIIPNVIANNK